MDENFDFIVIDSLNDAVEADLVPKETAESIEKLFKEADEFMSSLNWQQEDALLEASPKIVQGWQKQALSYIEQIEVHNKCKN